MGPARPAPQPLPISARCAQLYMQPPPQQEALLAKTSTRPGRTPDSRALDHAAHPAPLATTAATHWQLQVFGPANPLYANLRGIDRVLLYTGGARRWGCCCA